MPCPDRGGEGWLPGLVTDGDDRRVAPGLRVSAVGGAPGAVHRPLLAFVVLSRPGPASRTFVFSGLRGLIGIVHGWLITLIVSIRFPAPPPLNPAGLSLVGDPAARLICPTAG